MPTVRSFQGLAATALILAYAGLQPALAQDNAADRAGVEATLNAYQAASNAAAIKAVLPFYRPSAVGMDAIRRTHDADLRSFLFCIEFHIAELRLMSPG